MEIVEQEEKGENEIKGSELGNDYDSDPLIYQLVRVEGDGTLVPATEDEVLQFGAFGHLLDDGKVENVPSVEDIAEVESFLSANVLCTDNSDLKGFSQAGSSMKDEQKLKTDLEDANNTNKTDKTPPSEDISTETTQNSTIVNNAQVSETERTDATSTPSTIIPNNNTQHVPEIITVDSKPNFSLLAKDEICLDSLTIRELQEVFHATFGRLTNVKDKSWLKRRITMGITNTCQVPTSNFTIKDKNIVPMEGGVQYEQIIQTSCEAQKRMRNPSTNLDNNNNNISLEEDGGSSKRMRKPTKRYIEELSSLEYRDETMRAISSVGRDDHDRMVRSRVRSNREIGSWQNAFRTRNDSLGGFRVKVPFASRARRCRPRKNLVAFMPQAGGMFEEDGNIIEESETEEPTRKLRIPTKKRLRLRNIADLRGKENQEVVTMAELDMAAPEMMEHEAQSEGENNNHDDNNSNNHDECSSKPVSSKGGNIMRRKHHRAWTLCEVLKLVEGVARYGAGRWSEIRRLSFASYSYRTSVDLKDKWRNLLRASMAQPSEEREVKHTRKPATLPIPASILVRVRELAELHSPAGIEFPASKFTAVQHGGRKVVQGKSSGFL